MKILKKLFIVIIAIVALILITALFVQTDFTVMRTVEVAGEKAEVYEYLKFLENQEEYAVWQKKDPKTVNASKGTDGTVGFIRTWKSSHEEVGVGEQEITKLKEGERIDFALRFKEPMEMESTASMTTEAAGDNKTKVTWEFKGSTPYPFNIMFLFMDMDAELGPDLKNGLDNLKGIMDSRE
ncbi:MAG: hypothetical protein ACI837_000122 [Crocinitomicaceae bacterium]|jgi:hypothetical protein